MTYVEEICLAVIRTLDHASFHKGVRLAGYAANAEFWAAETRHALDCIEGFQTRCEKLIDARRRHAEAAGVDVDPSWVTPTVTAEELGKMKERLLASATRFFRLCKLDQGQKSQISLLLGIRIDVLPVYGR